MEILRTREQQRISRLVRAFVSPSTGAGERIAVAGELRAAIRSPTDIINCGTIPDDHPLKIEALAVRDAFEAATNGMASPEAEEAMDAIPRDAVFAPWVLLIRAIRDFYSGDSASAEAWAGRIPAGSYPARALPLFRRIGPGADGGGFAAGAVSPFKEALFPDGDALPRLVEEIREALGQGMPEFAAVRAIRLVREFTERPSADPKSAVLAILAEIDSQGSDPDPFIQGLRGFLGESETLRLVALYLRGRDPALALLYWLKAAALAAHGGGAGGLRAWIAAALVLAEPMGGDGGIDGSRSGEFGAILAEIESAAGLGGKEAPGKRGASGQAPLERLARLAERLGLDGPARGGKRARNADTARKRHKRQFILFPEEN
jgi:hypothetical protein